MEPVERPRTHKDLDVWTQAMDLVDEIYRRTRHFPSEELYGLVNQMRRAAISIPSNVAEGAARSGKKEFNQFLRVALGSLSELETQVLIAQRQGYLDDDVAVLRQIETVRRLLLGLIRHLKKEAA
jgi:four helix bundle protein